MDVEGVGLGALVGGAESIVQDALGLDNAIIILNSLWPLELDYIKKRQNSRQTGDEEGREEEVGEEERKEEGWEREKGKEKYV